MWACPRCGRSFGSRGQFHACDMRRPGGAMWQPPRGTRSAKPPTKPRGMRGTGWTCPRCRRTFKNSAQAHSCVTLTVDGFYQGKPAARRLHRLVAAFVRRHGGPFREHAQKTRVAFIATMSFAGIARAGADWVDFSIGLRRAVERPGLKVTQAAPTWFQHVRRVRGPEDLEGLEGLVAESYAMGVNQA